ncbi:hypothetical protein V6N13_036908 [Hibiscus sabdariffa]
MTQLLVKEWSNGRIVATSIIAESVCSHIVSTGVAKCWCKGVTNGDLPTKESMEEEFVPLFFSARWEYDHKVVLLIALGDEDAFRCKVLELIKSYKVKDAEQLLLTARIIGQETLVEESLVDDDIENEFSYIVIQLASLHQLIVAVNNLIVVKCPNDISDSLRKREQLKEKDSQKFELAHAIVLKLLPKHETIYANQTLLLHANKKDQARKLFSVLLETFTNCEMLILFQVVVLARENKVGETEERLGQFAEIIPENVAKWFAWEARMQELKTNMEVLGKEADATFADVEA